METIGRWRPAGYHPFDDLIRTFMQQSQCPISFDQMPQPTAADFDLDVYKSADTATKWIEQQRAAPSRGKAKSYAPVVVLGVGVVVVAELRSASLFPGRSRSFDATRR